MRPKRIVYRRVLIFFLVAMASVGLTTVALTAKPAATVTVQPSGPPSAGMPVTVAALTPLSRSVPIYAQGEVVPLWRTTLRAPVDGAVDYLSPRLQPGSRVTAGERLVGLAKNDYLLQVAEAKSRLADTTLDLIQEEAEAQTARRNWHRSGLTGTPDSPLVLRTPQLAAARARQTAAQAALAHAERLLRLTDIRAPYAGIIVERLVAPGATLFTGDEVATLYSTAAVEVGVALDHQQWALLPDPISDAQATLKDPHSAVNWKARVVRREHVRDRDARLRRLFLRVEHPLDLTPPLLPGSFVLVEIRGKTLPNLLGVPEAALTPTGEVWFVDGSDRLVARRPAPRFHTEGVAFVPKTADLPHPIRVAVHPNSRFTNGLKVRPRPAPAKRQYAEKVSQ
ncbi:MAG: efflux RND transporter periplasmic adaptor subunit [Desulfosarcinaceae bacterium]|nr:efflux RND transporter periplasmic adaptor subunit [Desulfosarcinaceae bacterium]